MHWIIAAPYFSSPSDRWLDDFVDDPSLHFTKVPAKYRHDRSRQKTSLRQWVDVFKHANSTLKIATQIQRREPCGIVTCFPQLAIAVALLSIGKGFKGPIVAWEFNIGSLPHGWRLRISTLALGRVNQFVVHSSQEVETYSKHLRLRADRFRYVPLQRAELEVSEEEDTTAPFLLAMGTAGRDYQLLFAALAALPYRAIVVAGDHAVKGLHVPRNVEVMSNLSLSECHSLLQRCRFSVTPMANLSTASGQVTILDAMMFGKAQIVTRCPGSIDYVNDEESAIMVTPGIINELKSAIVRLWEDDSLRLRLGTTARKSVLAKHSDSAAARNLLDVLSVWSD